MASNDYIERRLAALEHEVRLARTEASTALALAKRATRDAPLIGDDWRFERALISSIYQIQDAHGDTLRDSRKQLDSVAIRLDGEFAKINSEQDKIITLLQQIIDKDK
ncbi:hypothetical protein DMH04_06465 [Kibdelosporangium aridum]|uniref:Uncharacterized protein n=1 Tax=Kibdelosporangium aridum TaxID=2030 RepID=A0A428ZNJ5_KIBAR|nr:hypothetical protein [Kibdelosporangium aridum]RSM89616.1 hypothetical protein DMH04_06465 [Kibdelosporangium aridum]